METFFITNSNKRNNQAANCPKGEIGNGKNPKNVWSYHHRLQLCGKIKGLSEHQRETVAHIVKVSDSYIIKIIKFYMPFSNAKSKKEIHHFLYLFLMQIYRLK